jgi:FHA domain
MLAVEINDAGLLLARTGADGVPVAVGEESPGFALLHEGRVHVGAEAARRHRVAPLHAQNRFWHALSLDPLPWSTRGFATAADLAHAHLAAVLEPGARAGDQELLLAVSSGYTREQLGLLVGIANECGVVVRGLVDAGLAAASTVAPSPCMLHLDLQLHQVAATLLEASRADGTLRRTRYELLPGVGLLAFQQAIAATIATTFVRDTRFDPLHQAATEQRLHDLLPTWLQALAAAEEVEAEIEFGGTAHRVRLVRAQVVDAIEALTTEVLRLVQSARPPGALMHLCFSPRIAAVPGLVARLAGLRDCVMVELPPGAAARGALKSAAAIVRPADAITLVHRLPLADAGVADDPSGQPATEVPADAIPTHVLFNGRAWPISSTPLTLGWSVGAAARALTLPAGIAGVSRSHCTLEHRGGQAVVSDHSTYGTFVNDERVGGHVALRVGDVLRLGAPGVALELIRVLPDHGAS